MVGAAGERLYDRFGPRFTLIAFTDAARFAALPLQVLGFEADSTVGRLFDARPGSCYLVRPTTGWPRAGARPRPSRWTKP